MNKKTAATPVPGGVQFDFGGIYAITRYVVPLPHDSAFKFELSEDGADWTAAVAGQTIPGNYFTDTDLAQPVNARYARITFVNSDSENPAVPAGNGNVEIYGIVR
jgi:hypothetical protein